MPKPGRFLLLLAVLCVGGFAISPAARVASAETAQAQEVEHNGPETQESPDGKVFDPQEWLAEKMSNAHTLLILLVMVGSILSLGKGADWLVEEAVELSLRSGVPRVVVGATAVSLGTTAPEAVVSVLAALQGNPQIALGNAVGSIICDTGLILGTACLIGRVPINRDLVNRQGWIQFGCGVLLVVACVPWANPMSAFETGSTLPQIWGFGLLVLLVLYMAWSVKAARATPQETEDEELAFEIHSIAFLLLRLMVAVAIVVVSSWVLIGAAITLAERWNVPESIIATTLVAFGTSLPELIIAITAVRKNQGELALGNVIGADILNVLFVAGAAAAVTSAGLDAVPHFFHLQFPAMLFILLVFRLGIWTGNRSGELPRVFGAVLVGVYVAVTVLSYVLRP